MSDFLKFAYELIAQIIYNLLEAAGMLEKLPDVK